MTHDAHETLNRQPNSHGCFVCGLSNPIGLKIVFHEDRDSNAVTRRADRSGHLSQLSRRRPRGNCGHHSRRDVGASAHDPQRRLERLFCHRPDGGALSPGYADQHTADSHRLGRAILAAGRCVRGQLCLRDGVEGPDRVVLAECESLVVRPQAEFLGQWDQEVPYWRVYSDDELAERGAAPGA